MRVEHYLDLNFILNVSNILAQSFCPKITVLFLENINVRSIQMEKYYFYNNLILTSIGPED